MTWLVFVVGMMVGAGVSVILMGILTAGKWEDLERENMTLRGKVFDKIPEMERPVPEWEECFPDIHLE